MPYIEKNGNKFDLDNSGKANTADLATVATTGSYTDLSDKPTIPEAVTVTNTGDVYIGSQLIRKMLTQAEYDALTTKDSKVEYCIIESV